MFDRAVDHRDAHGGKDAADVHGAAHSVAGGTTGRPLATEGQVVVQRAAGNQARSLDDLDGAAGTGVGSERGRGGDTIAGATDGLIVIEDTVIDIQHHRLRPSRVAASNGPTAAGAGGEWTHIVVAADGLVVAERAAGDGEHAAVHDGAAKAQTSEVTSVATAAAAALGHVAVELSIDDGDGLSIPAVRDTATRGKAGDGTGLPSAPGPGY